MSKSSAEDIKNKSASQEQAPGRDEYEKGRKFLEEGETAMAAAAFHNALLVFEQHHDENGMANAADKLGDVCLTRDDYAGAHDHFRRAYDICKNNNDTFSLMSLDKKIAKCKRGLKKYDEAIAIYLDLLDYYGDLNNPKGTVEVLETMAEIYCETGEREKAADAYRTAASIHDRFKHRRHARQLLDKADEVMKKA